jgi:signal transduction histidine kinase
MGTQEKQGKPGKMGMHEKSCDASLHTISWKYLSDAIAQKLQWHREEAGAIHYAENPDQEISGIDDNFYRTTLCEVLLQAQEQDRLRIANDLHDSIGQNLSAVKMSIECARRATGTDDEEYQRILTGALSRLQLSIEELRRIALDLRPSMLNDLGLLATMEWCCREFDECNPGLRLEKHFDIADEAVPDSLRNDIYRLLQESLHNIDKHAAAQHVEVLFRRENELLLLSVRDDGCGFDMAGKGGVGMGLFSMQARIVRSGGRVNIYSEAGTGTHIVFRWLLSPNQEHSEVVPFVERRGKYRRHEDCRTM